MVVHENIFTYANGMMNDWLDSRIVWYKLTYAAAFKWKPLQYFFFSRPFLHNQ